MKTILIRARATDSAIYKVAESLSKNGHEVILLVWDRQYTLKGPSAARYRIKIFRLRSPQDDWKVVFYLPLWWLYEFYYLLKNDSDVIHACDMDTLWPAIFISVIKGKRLFYTIYDFYASNIPSVKPYFIIKLIRAALSSIERYGIGFTDALFLVDECRYQQVKGARINQLAYIYNSPPDRNNVKTSNGDTDNITLFYGGSLHHSRGLHYIIKALEGLDHIKLIIAGTGPIQDYLEHVPHHLREKIKYIGQVPYEEIINKTIGADILFAFYDPSTPSNEYASPNKLFEAMMCGKPILINEEVSAARIVREENCGITIPYGNVEAIKNAIVRLGDRDLRMRYGNNGRNAYDKKYGWSIMENRLLSIYNV